MADKLPGARAALVDNAGVTTPPFYRYFQALERLQAGTASAADVAAINAQIAAINAEIAALPKSSLPTLQVSAPLTSAGLLQNGFAKLGLTVANSVVVNGVALQLSGDALAPGNTLYYGTGPTGTKGWNTIASALLGSASVTLTTAANGVTTFSLPVPTGDLSGAWPGSQVVSTHLTNPLPVAQGGTAQASLTAHAVLLGEGTEGVGNAPTGTAGALLVDQGASADPAFKPLSGDATLAAGGALTLAASGVTAGAYGDATHWPKITLDAKGRATAAQNIALPLLQGYIDGLQMQWVSGTAITVTSGTAYIPGLSAYLQSNAAINLTGLSLIASTWYHLYLYSNAGTPAVECVTTAPVLYYGTAYQKTGDNTRRYIGSILTDASSNIYDFSHLGNSIKWLVDLVFGAPVFRVLDGGTSTTTTTFSASSSLPTTAIFAMLRLSNTDTTNDWEINATGVSIGLTGGQTRIIHGQVQFSEFAIGINNQFDYGWRVAPVSGAAYVDVAGYIFQR